jgi:hypothetical protein
MTVARSTKPKLKETITALVDLAAGPGTARAIKGKAKDLASTGASRLARVAAVAAVRLEAEGKADAIAGRLEAEATRDLKQTRARLKSTSQAHTGTAQHGVKK